MTRMIPFIFSSTVAYTIELGEFYASFFFDGELLNGDGAPIETPYLEADLLALNIEQVGDVIWICCSTRASSPITVPNAWLIPILHFDNSFSRLGIIAICHRSISFSFL